MSFPAMPLRFLKTLFVDAARPETRQALAGARHADFPQFPSFIDKPQ
jgi:hypothetical protein